MDMHNYIMSGALRQNVEQVAEAYLNNLDSISFMRQTDDFFYEYTLQGFIYYYLVLNGDISRNENYLIFLEQPYSSVDMQRRSDIMFVDTAQKKPPVSAIEIKNNFNYESIRLDMYVLADNIDAQNIDFGYGIFFVKETKTIDLWINNMKADQRLKPYFEAGRLFAIGMVVDKDD